MSTARRSNLRLLLRFEWGGGALWPADRPTADRLGPGAAEAVLSIPPDLRTRLAQLEARHNTALNWDDPAAASPWTEAERRAFDADARNLATRLASALGATVAYVS